MNLTSKLIKQIKTLLKAGNFQLSCMAMIYGFIFSCSNNPYPDEASLGKVLYTTTKAAVKNLDPQQSYNMGDLAYLRLCYEPLIDYHYLDQTRLVPSLAAEMPQATINKDFNGEIKEVRYSFKLREGVHFINDPCFINGKGREMTAKDFEYVFKRVADPATNCPIYDSLTYIKGFKDFGNKVEIMRDMKIAGKEFQKGTESYINSSELYNEAGDLPGIEVTGKYSFDLILSEKYPQILYWLAMRFISAVPHEAVDFYHPEKTMNNNEPVNFGLRPVGTGPYKFLWSEFRKSQKVAMGKNPHWWGNKTKSAVSNFPMKPFSELDVKNAYWTPEDAGRKTAQPDKIIWYKETEELTKFNKFMQGYYDVNILPPEKVSEALTGQNLTEDMQARGIKMNKSVELSFRYIGFNMGDKTVGHVEDKAQAEKNKKLRQAMNLAIDSEEFIRVHMKGMGVAAHSPLPPGIAGHDPAFKNPYKYINSSSLKKAKELLTEAGYEDGIDPKTGKALELNFTISIRSPEDEIMFQFFVDCWQKIGLNVELDKNEFNQFQKKVFGMNYQIFYWGWSADYPDPENFLFLLYSKNNPIPNHTQFNSPEFDKYFKLMETMTNDETKTWTETDESGNSVTKTATRKELVQKCLDIFTEESPWILVYYDVYFQLYHDWVKNVKNHSLISYPYQYYDLHVPSRSTKREAWNKKIMWPLYAAFIAALAFVIPAFSTYIKERN